MARGHVVTDWNDPSNGILSPEVRELLEKSGFKFDTSGRLMNLRRVQDKDKDVRVPKVFLIEVPPDCDYVMVTQRGAEWRTKFHGKPIEAAPRAASGKKKAVEPVVRSATQGIGRIA